jgi:hypothetical protein
MVKPSYVRSFGMKFSLNEMLAIVCVLSFWIAEIYGEYWLKESRPCYIGASNFLLLAILMRTFVISNRLTPND